MVSKRIFSVLLVLFMFMIAPHSIIAGDIKSWMDEFLSVTIADPDRFEAPYEVIFRYTVENGKKGFALLQHEEDYRILVLDKQDNDWCIEVISNSVPVIDGMIPYIHGSYVGAFYLNYSSNPEEPYQCRMYTFRNIIDDTWTLIDYSISIKDSNGSSFSVEAFFHKYRMNLMVSDDGKIDEFAIYGTIDRDLRSISMHDIPITYNEAIHQVHTEGLMAISNSDLHSRLALREAPDSRSPIIGEYCNGVIVALQSIRDDGWALIDIEGVSGYVMRKDLHPVDRYAEIQVEYTQRWLGYDEATIVYTEPGIESEAILVLPKSAEINLLGFYADGWCHVLCRDYEIAGFIQYNGD